MPTDVLGDGGKRRLIAMIIDNLLAAILAIAIASNIPALEDLGRGLTLVAVYLSYYLLPEALWGRTPGKLAVGLVVERFDGERCGLPGAIVRTLLRIVEVNPLLFGALPGGLAVILSKRKQRIGDMLAGTLVLRSTSRSG